MTGPKHLWSGDWQRESADPPRQVAPQPTRAPWTPAPTPDPPQRTGRSARDRVRLLAPLMTAAAVVAVVLIVLGTTGGSPAHKPVSRASAPTVTGSSPVNPNPNPATPAPSNPGAGGAGTGTPATTITGHTINWLGMQIATVQGTGAVVQTVQLGTPADAVGLDPGDVIQTINGHEIATADQIAPAVQGLSRGDSVKIAVERGSTLFTAVAPFDGHPTTAP